MAVVRTSKFDEIPKDAEVISKREAILEQLRLIQEWPSVSDVWPLRFSSTILGVTSVVSSVYVNNHFRRKLKLMNYNKFSSYLPTVVLPAIMTTLFHANFITTNVIIHNYNCAACIQSRAMAIQVGFGALYPCILGPISSFMLATRNYTFRLPSITENPMEILRIAQKMFRPIHTQIVGFTILNAMVASFLTYKEIDSFYKLNEKIIKELEEYEMKD